MRKMEDRENRCHLTYINNKKKNVLRLIVNYNLFPRIDCIPSQQFNINLCSVW